MTSNYRRPATIAVAETVVKNSRFIAVVDVMKQPEDLHQLSDRAMQQWPKASHYCTASILGSPQQGTFSCNDDGEPSGTAGRPMLTVLQNAPLGDVAAVVVRYFGGVKLGTGGLQRAYGQAVAAALKKLPTELVVYRESFELDYPYHLQGAIEPLWQQFDVRVSDSQFTEQVHQRIELIPDELAPLQERLDAVSQGQLKLRKC